jgi:glycosidase
MRRLPLLLLPFVLLIAPVVGADANPSARWYDRVFYQIFVRSFYDSDGDGVGDLRGIIEKLDYLNDGDPTTDDDLGVTGLWLMPVTEAASYHGYDVTDYRAVETDYGTAEDFRDLIAAAHERGIMVIVDLVINHTSSQHPWFISSALGPSAPYADYYIWEPEDPNWSGPDGQQVWHPLGGRYYYALFWGGMPDLNFYNPEVTAEMHAIADYWLTEMGVDGFRIDAVKHIVEQGRQQENTLGTLAWMNAFNAHTEAVKPGALTVGEIWSGMPVVARYVPDSVDTAFDFDLALQMVDASRRRSRSALEQLQARALDTYSAPYAAFLTNHDQNRVMSELRGDVGAAKVAASLLLTGPGVPFIYYGEEIGMEGQKPDPRIRTPMQWTGDDLAAGFSTVAPYETLDPSYATANVAAQIDDPGSLLSHYRALIHLRNGHPALRVGDWIPVESDQRPVYSYLRHTDGETLLVLINMNHRAIEEYALALEASPLAGPLTAEVLYGPGTVDAAPVVDAAGGFSDYRPFATLPPRTTWVIRLGSDD